MEPPFKCYIYQTCSGKVGTGLFLADGSEIMGKSVKNGTVIGEFVCNKFIPYCSARPILDAETVETQACLTRKEVWEYCPAGNPIGWHISELVISNKPKELSEFSAPGKCPYNTLDGCTYKYHCFRAGKADRCGKFLERPPQSWCYVEELPGGGSDG